MVITTNGGVIQTDTSLLQVAPPPLLATSNDSGHNDFIIPSGLPGDWLATPDTNLWQGEAGINNPCPDDFRLPTEAEFVTLNSNASLTNSTTAASSSLAFSTPGSRSLSNATLINLGIRGRYWTPSPWIYNSNHSTLILFIETSVYTTIATRATGLSVRCFKDY